MADRRWKHKFLMLYSGAVRLLTVLALDELPFLRRLRGRLYGLAMPAAGADFEVSFDVVLWGLEHLSVGRNVYVGPGVKMICLDKVTIGNDVLFGPHVVISNGNHKLIDGVYSRTENETAPVSIGDGSWIGANSTILAGVSIGRGVLVAANSAVTGSVEDHDIVGGVPARSLKKGKLEGGHA